MCPLGSSRSRTVFASGASNRTGIFGWCVTDDGFSPLLPSTCQSVRMDFLALASGVHSIDVLTLTDVQTGLTMHLRYVRCFVLTGCESSEQRPLQERH